MTSKSEGGGMHVRCFVCHVKVGLLVSRNIRELPGKHMILKSCDNISTLCYRSLIIMEVTGNSCQYKRSVVKGWILKINRSRNGYLKGIQRLIGKAPLYKVSILYKNIPGPVMSLKLVSKLIQYALLQQKNLLRALENCIFNFILTVLTKYQCPCRNKWSFFFFP